MGGPGITPNERPTTETAKPDRRRDPKTTERARAMAIQARQDKANRAAEALIPTIVELRAQGASLAEVAARLNVRGARTLLGNSFSAEAVRRILLKHGLSTERPEKPVRSSQRPGQDAGSRPA